MKAELKKQFLPSNTSWLAKDSLRKSKHSSTVRDYVNNFSTLLSDVKDMSEEKKLFNCMDGLVSWAQAELRRPGVKDVTQAIVAKSLSDYKTSSSSPSSDHGKKKSSLRRTRLRQSSINGKGNQRPALETLRRRGIVLRNLPLDVSCAEEPMLLRIAQIVKRWLPLASL